MCCDLETRCRREMWGGRDIERHMDTEICGTHIHACIHAYMHTYKHTSMHACTYTCIHTTNTPTYIHTYMHTYIHDHQQQTHGFGLQTTLGRQKTVHVYVHVYPGNTQQRKENQQKNQQYPHSPAFGWAVWILLICLLIFPCVAVYVLDIFLDMYMYSFLESKCGLESKSMGLLFRSLWGHTFWIGVGSILTAKVDSS